MRPRHVALVVLVVAVGAANACSLNPQPLPPDEPDGGLSVDATVGAGDDSGTAFGDSSMPPTDGGVKGSDASDASEDASDASNPDASDASEVSDASDDARDDDD
jgi:hypothetical protein